MEISVKDIQSKIEDADLVLIGIGEEFESKALIEQDELYIKACDEIKKRGYEDIYPYVSYFFLKEKKAEILSSYRKLFSLIENKNYFIISTCMNNDLNIVGFRGDRVVQPCGNFARMQCQNGCDEVLKDTPEVFLKEIEECCMGRKAWDELKFPVCEECGSRLVFNTLYAEKYNEKGYLENWATYMKWLQGTVNKKLCILELGVGLQFPSVVRWPFEKTAFYNKKSVFIRIHEHLYQLTPELKEQGYFIPQNAFSVLNLL